MIRERLARSERLVLDGGFATELERRGVPSSGALWSTRAVVDHPDAVRALHRDYLLAGADVISTATYQAALPALSRASLDAVEVLARAIALAREARDEARPSAIVAASMGPYGAHLADGSEYRGDYRIEAEELSRFHEAQAEQMLRAGAEALAFETVPSLFEAEAILSAIERLGAEEVWISFSLRDGGHTSAGDAVSGAIGLVAPHVAAAGFNCASAEAIERALTACTGVALVAYPNSGERWDARDRCWSGEPEDLERRARRFIDAGARLVGGCCRTGPDDVARIARALRPGTP